MLVGSQQPRIFYAPSADSFEVGDAALELAHHAGIRPDPWQEDSVRAILATRADGAWAASKSGECVPRQNGKGGIIEILQLNSMYVLERRLIVYSAHEFKTSLEAFRRLEELVAGTPDLARRVKRVSRSHGEEGIELKSGVRVRFFTRTKSGGRGLTGDDLYLDEAMILPEWTMGAIVPTMSARPGSQLHLFGSAVDQQLHEHGIAFARLRAAAIAGTDPDLVYIEFAADPPEINEDRPVTPDDVTGAMAVSREAWAQANPSLGIRISEQAIERERTTMGRRTFAVERLGIGDWPDVDEEDGGIVFDRAKWAALEDGESTVAERPCFAFDVSPSRSHSTIAVAGVREDGLSHLEVVATGRGTGWVEDRLVELKQHRPLSFVCDGQSAAASLVEGLKQRGVRVTVTTAAQMADACGQLDDAVEHATMRHLGQEELWDAIRAAAKRPLGDRWAWSRKGSRGDITPLTSVTLALWGVRQGKPRVKPFAMSW